MKGVAKLAAGAGHVAYAERPDATAGPGEVVIELLAAGICGTLRVTAGGTSKLVDRIEAAGLFACSPDPDDRRAARVSLTPAGERALRAAIETYQAELAAFLDPVLDAREQEEMHGFVRPLLDAAGDGVQS
jgi:DNA-binding MarR family transcriptional regulator